MRIKYLALANVQVEISAGVIYNLKKDNFLIFDFEVADGEKKVAEGRLRKIKYHDSDHEEDLSAQATGSNRHFVLQNSDHYIPGTMEVWIDGVQWFSTTNPAAEDKYLENPDGGSFDFTLNTDPPQADTEEIIVKCKI